MVAFSDAFELFYSALTKAKSRKVSERTTQREQNINRKVIMGPDHFFVRELRQQW